MLALFFFFPVGAAGVTPADKTIQHYSLLSIIFLGQFIMLNFKGSKLFPAHPNFILSFFSGTTATGE